MEFLLFFFLFYNFPFQLVSTFHGQPLQFMHSLFFLRLKVLVIVKQTVRQSHCKSLFPHYVLSRSCLPAGPEHFKSHSSVPEFGAQFAYVASSQREYLAQRIVTQQVPGAELCTLFECVVFLFALKI